MRSNLGAVLSRGGWKSVMLHRWSKWLKGFLHHSYFPEELPYQVWEIPEGNK